MGSQKVTDMGFSGVICFLGREGDFGLPIWKDGQSNIETSKLHDIQEQKLTSQKRGGETEMRLNSSLPQPLNDPL